MAKRVSRKKPKANNSKTTRKKSRLDNFGDKVNTAGLAENPQNINRKGRPKKLLNLAKDAGYKRSEVLEVMSYVLTMNEEERAAHLLDKPDGLESICIRAVDKASAKGEYNKAKDIIEQVIGKAQQKVDVTTGGEKIKLDGDDLERRIKELEGGVKIEKK